MEIDRSLISGSVALLVMKLLEDGDMYGYQMTEELKRRSDDTFHLKTGSLYPYCMALKRRDMFQLMSGMRQRESPGAIII